MIVDQQGTATCKSSISRQFNPTENSIEFFLNTHIEWSLSHQDLVITIVSFAKSLMNCLQQLVDPRNFCISFTFLGIGQFKTPPTFSFYISTPFGSITTPRNFISFTFHQHFSGFIKRLFSLSHFNTFSIISSCFSSVSIATIILSMKVAVLP